MLSWWWVMPLSVAAAGAAVLSVLAGRLRREVAAVQQTAAQLQVAAGRSSGPAGPG
ncbi:MAG: hypothetical protein J2P57_17520 [Acidimicrobiaceae bacterium]|nr:hypothetical protein [Acidimicrobiaceae bacterium]